jgi:colanic acid biosynthesis glycosyl transferase WcaI
MKLLIYGLNFWPELTGIGKYSGEMAAWFAAQGHEVEVVTAPPYYPAWQISEGFSGARYTTEHWGPGGRVQITRCPLWVPKKVTGKSRLLHLASFALSSALPLLRALRRKPDLMLVVVPTLMTAPAGLLAARLTGVPAWLHVQDFEVDAMLGMGIVGGGGLFRKLAFSIERMVLQRFDRVSSISRKMCDRLLSKGVEPARVVEFPNWVDLSSIYPLSGPNALRAELKLRPDELVVLYSGNMGEKQGIEVVIEAARRLSHRTDIKFVLAGAGAARERLQSSAAGLSNIQWLPLQPTERLNELLNAADIHVLPQRADAADLVMPSKLTGMLASARPVIGTADAATQLGMVLAQCGVRVDPDDAPALATAIEALIIDGNRRTRLGTAGRLYAEQHLARDAILGQIEAAFLAVRQNQFVMANRYES